jgi:hypothetical protein
MITDLDARQYRKWHDGPKSSWPQETPRWGVDTGLPSDIGTHCLLEIRRAGQAITPQHRAGSSGHSAAYRPPFLALRVDVPRATSTFW